MDLSLLWIPATVAAAAAQTARNAMQRQLTELIGTVGATQVRFLYGFPFALAFLAVVLAVGSEPLPAAGPRFLAFALGGALAQILATALMLAAMRERSFAVTIAYTKTEPVQVALFGFLVLGDPLSALGATAVVIATVGVVLMSVKPGAQSVSAAGLRPAALGIASGAFFALAAIGFRGAIVALPEGSFVLRATTTLAWSLGLQTALLGVYLALFDRGALLGSLKAWRPSLFAGFMGALASQFWFLGFSLTAAANVRTLGLVEVLFVQAVSRKLFSQKSSPREFGGIALVLIGVGLLLAAQ
ncbi:EamA family transporter [Chelatococcus sp. SYSU_G07232]|uniref:EamA family transporter n=1 Tax=Chelatococcus albus TaxID=3047466 RepID=A0ABT7ADD3_9HYPH|nr:EamA family transporter [Chelatococcus sp. SYSU_G07232]MDJ1157392.1 EamA family transporter [Chelatococcus sp. SYSU_G07232]